MGGGYYDIDVGLEARATQREVFSYRGHGVDASRASGHGHVHPELDPKGCIRECMNTTPIVVAMDVTRSRGQDSHIVYNKLPMLIGQLDLHHYVEGAAISFAAVGDATDNDRAPIQVGQFEADNRLDDVLSKLWIEEGGGGSGQESYELMAYFYARHSELASLTRGERGYFFFIGDEGFYPKVSREQVKAWLGREIDADVDARDIFRELQEKYRVFFIYPRKSWQERRRDIDAEIRQRVVAAGGCYDDVDIRASLLWDNRNDLDLHVITPSGEEIYYGDKRSRCGGWLDVDMNVRGETTKPVENIRWRRGEAPAGQYRVIVQNYRFHERDKAPTSYRLEVEVNGEVQHFEGVISPRGETGRSSNVLVHTFKYDPDARVEPELDDTRYDNYRDEHILEQWRSVIPPEHILTIEDPHAIVDVLLGALALSSGHTDLDSYVALMRQRDQSDPRCRQTRAALQDLSAQHALARVDVSTQLVKGKGKQRGGRAVRL